MERLAVEIKLRIIRMLDERSIARFGQTCKAHHALACDSLLWENMLSVRFGEINGKFRGVPSGVYKLAMRVKAPSASRSLAGLQVTVTADDLVTDANRPADSVVSRTQPFNTRPVPDTDWRIMEMDEPIHVGNWSGARSFHDVSFSIIDHDSRVAKVNFELDCVMLRRIDQPARRQVRSGPIMLDPLQDGEDYIPLTDVEEHGEHSGFKGSQQQQQQHPQQQHAQQDAASSQGAAGLSRRRLFIGHNVALAVLFGALFAAALYRKGLGALLTWHVLGESIFVAMLVNAISVLQGTSMNGRKQAMEVHWKLQLLGLAGGIVGSSLIFMHIQMEEEPHFESVHSIIGGLTLLASILLAGWNSFIKWSPASLVTIPATLRKVSNTIHRYSGYAAGVGLIITVALALDFHFVEDSFSLLGYGVLYLSLAGASVNATGIKILKNAGYQ
eukprot:jgi/Hompol1/6839/HPOL_000472-RA